MADLSWFRVVTDNSGRIVSVRLVEAGGEATRGVFYVQALDDAAARELARLQWNERQRIAQLALRNERDGSGKCPRCGGLRDRLPLKTCSKCLEKQSEYDDRAKAKRRGEKVPPKDRRETIARNRIDEAALQRLSVIEEIDEVWSTRGTIGLRQWLRKELAALRGKAVA